MKDWERFNDQFRETEEERNERQRTNRLRRALKCSGVGRDKDCISALQFYFSRRVTDDEMRFLHEVMQRSVACMPRLSGEETRPTNAQ